MAHALQPKTVVTEPNPELNATTKKMVQKMRIINKSTENISEFIKIIQTLKDSIVKQRIYFCGHSQCKKLTKQDIIHRLINQMDLEEQNEEATTEAEVAAAEAATGAEAAAAGVDRGDPTKA